MIRFPTPWTTDGYAILSANGNYVVARHHTGGYAQIPLDELVARMNAGAEAIERLAFMTKVAEAATREMRIMPGARLIPERIVLNGQTIARTDDVTADELTTYLKEKDEA